MKRLFSTLKMALKASMTSNEQNVNDPHANSLYKTINAENAAALDKDLMSVGAFSIDQLMELAGLSVAQACISPPTPSYLLFLLIFNSIPSPRPLQRKEHPHRLRSRKQRYSLLPPAALSMTSLWSY